MKITSLSNPKIKEIVKLSESSQRKKQGLILVEGIREIKLALQAGFTLKELFVCQSLINKAEKEDLLKKVKGQKSEVIEVDEKVYAKISYGDRSEGLLAVFISRRGSLCNINVEQDSLLLIVEQVEKPGNLGAMLRSADACGVDAVIVCDQQTDLFNPNVIRSSLGAIFTTPTIVETKENILKFLKDNHFTIASTTPSAKTVYTLANLKGKLAVVVGSEKDGLSDFWLKAADLKIKIPMKGHVDSLNVSVSTAVVLYEVLRQRN